MRPIHFPRWQSQCEHSIMLAKVLLYFIIFKMVMTQMNGEFWWLNRKLAQLKLVEPPQPKFEDLSEFDTDESAKVIFKDGLYNIAHTEKYPVTTTEKMKTPGAIIYFRDNSKLIAQSNADKSENSVIQNNKINLTRKESVKDIQKEEKDVFNFIFPDNAIINKNKFQTAELTSKNKATHTTQSVNLNNKILFNTRNEKLLSENICTQITVEECMRCNGYIYNTQDTQNSKRNSMDSEYICCILPLKETPSQIIFRDNFNRRKRSSSEMYTSTSLKQRNALMQRKYGSQTGKTQAPSTTTIAQKIVTPDKEYIDPYWNIRGYNYNNPRQVNDDYYSEELPKPGLAGLYSDHSPSSWTFINTHNDFLHNIEENSKESTGTFGYSTINPRKGNSATLIPKRRIVKHTSIYSGYGNTEPDSGTISYISNPDFKVLHGFKLSNLMRKPKARPSLNMELTPITESSISDHLKSDYDSNKNNEYDDFLDSHEDLYQGCGRAKNRYIINHKCEREIGDSPKGSHPWLLLAVLTKRKQSILCYATLVHPRAAVTAADCTYGIAPGEITAVAGMWDLKEDNLTQLQHRLATVYAHQQYLPGKLAYNIALLYWRRPFQLDVTVQPVCVSDVNFDDCSFVGWGGYDQEISQNQQWQRATILSTRDCNEEISANQEFDVPVDAFCATVNSKTTVTGLGGPLICRTDGVHSLAGLAIWRDNQIVLMRAREWTARVMAALNIR